MDTARRSGERRGVANLIVTNACNLSCSFCFASEYLANEPGASRERMSTDEVKAQLTFAPGDARFCGGEPTSHPDFVAMLDEALSVRGRDVFVMTNGVWPDVVREHVRALPARDRGRIRCLINVLAPDFYTDAQLAVLEATLASLHPNRVTLGFTIADPGFDFGYVLALADRLGVQKLRYSVASPNVTDPRTWHLDPRADYRPLADVVHRLHLEVRDRGLLINSDCGYLPPCVFTEEQLRDLAPWREEDRLRFHCEGPIDIGPGGDAWRCYGLYSLVRGRTDDFDDLDDMAASFEAETERIGAQYDLFDECATCDWRARGECAGGCYAQRAVDGMRRRADAAGASVGEDDGFYEAVPARSAERLHDRGEQTLFLDREGVWGPLALDDGEARVLAACDGERTVQQVIDAASGAELRRYSRAAVARTVRGLFERGVLDLNAPARRGLRVLP